MADRYVWSGATGTGTGADWTNAHTSITTAITAGAAGDRYFIAHDHAETLTATITWKGTITAPDSLICVDRAGSNSYADLRTTATISFNVTAAVTFGGVLGYCYGVVWNIGTSTTANFGISFGSSNGARKAERCTFNFGSTGTGSKTIGGTGLVLVNCNVSYAANASSILSAQGTPQIINEPGFPFLTGTVSRVGAGGMIMANLNASSTELRGLDLSGIGGRIWQSGSYGIHRAVNCKLSTTTLSSLHWGCDTHVIYFEVANCSVAGAMVPDTRMGRGGTLTVETVVVRTDGASDGTTPVSWKIVPTTDNRAEVPFETFEGVIWNETVGSPKTLTVHVINGDGVTLTDEDIYVDVEYLSDANVPASSRSADAVATLSSPVAQADDSATAWTTTGLTTPVKQKLEVTFTPQMKGLIRWRVKYAKTSTTVYVCPKADLT